MPWKTTCETEQKHKFILEFMRQKCSRTELCRHWQISRKTAYKWLRRFEQKGGAGLVDLARAPLHPYRRPTTVWLKRLRRWKLRHPFWGAPKLYWGLKRRFGVKGLPSESAIGRWLKQWGLTGRRRRRATRKGPVIERPPLTKAVAPNDVWTVDFKGWFRTRDGTKVEPLTVRDLACFYTLAIVHLPDQQVETCIPVFTKIFKTYGLPKVMRMDNGSPFGSIGALGLTRLSAWWVKLGIRVEFIAPGCPGQNGSHEQFHSVYKAEQLNPPAYSLRAQQRRSEVWRAQYNKVRPHETLAGKVPADFYRKSRRKLPTKVKVWRYPAGWATRRVRSKGMISFYGQGRFVGEAFECERVGLKMVRGGVWELYYGPLLVGELWANENGAIRAAWHRQKRQRQ